MSGWALGALAALAGRRAVYITIAAVETFVVAHYQQQIDRLIDEQIYPEISAVLRSFQTDEEHHQIDAEQRGKGEAPGLVARLWAGLVGAGSSAAVVIAKRI
jgi:ubiquinone biosynthesis monooxygenase Coq7